MKWYNASENEKYKININDMNTKQTHLLFSLFIILYFIILLFLLSICLYPNVPYMAMYCIHYSGQWTQIWLHLNFLYILSMLSKFSFWSGFQLVSGSELKHHNQNLVLPLEDKTFFSILDRVQYPENLNIIKPICSLLSLLCSLRIHIS